MNVMTQQGDMIVLDMFSGAFPGGDIKLKLFKNNHVPDVTDTEGDYTEADFSGYSSTSPAITWGAAFVNGDDKGEIDADVKTFTHNGGGTGNTVYGAYVTDDTDRLIYAERFDAPVSMSSNGDAINYTAKMTAVQE